VLDDAGTCSPVRGEVQVGVSTDGADALSGVSDQGPGPGEAEVPRLFDRFHRGTAARDAEVPGFGLGLAISRAVIERQGGSISADAAPNGGALFRIRLPLAH